jgi:hypothetical protein
LNNNFGIVCASILMDSQKAGYGALCLSLGNEVSPLWEWLPATIFAARCRSHSKLTNPAATGGVYPVNARINFIAASCGE